MELPRLSTFIRHVSLRRLRSALKHFSAWSDELNPVWEEQIAELFRQLGDTRDEDAIRTEILPMIVQHGSPELLLPPLNSH